MEADLTEIKSVIRGLLISTPKATTIETLKRDYISEVGEPIPYYKFGHKNVLEFLKSLSDTVVIDFNRILNSYTVVPVSSEKTAHVEALVMKQKVSQPSSWKKLQRSSQFYGYSTRRVPTLVRRPPAVINPTPVNNTNQLLTYTTERNIIRYVSLYSEGVPVHTVMTKFMRDLVTTVDEAKMVLSNVDSLEIQNSMVYPTRMKNYGQSQTSKDTYDSQPTSKDTRINFHPVFQNGHSSTESNISQSHSTYQVVPEDFEEDVSDVEEVNNMIDRYSGGFWDVEESCEKSFSLSNAEGNHGISRTSSSQGENISLVYNICNSNGNIHEDNGDSCSAGSYSSLISTHVEDNIRYLLGKHPEGILSAQFEKKYQDEFGKTFTHTDFGFVSIIQMAAALRHLFKIVAVSGTTDWKLFDAKAVVTQQSCVNGDPVVPSNVRNQILELVNRHPSGLESARLEQLYEATYQLKLNPKGMGFADLEACLMALFDDVSLKYVHGKIYIRPKMARWADILKNPPLPAKSPVDVLEELNKFYPPEALRLDYVLPHESLPPNLKPKSLLSILVLDVVSPSQWFFLKYENSMPFEDFMDELQDFYNAEGSSLRMHPKTVWKNHLCVAEYVDPNNMSRDWCRARIKEVNPDGTVKLFFIDYGSRATVKISELKYLHQNYSGYPAQAFRGTMYGIEPPNGKSNIWPEESCKTLLKLVSAKGIQAEVVEVDYQNFWVSAYLVDTNTPEDVILNNVLVERGLAQISLFEDEREKTGPQEDKVEDACFTDWKNEFSEKHEQTEPVAELPILQNTSGHNHAQSTENKVHWGHSQASSVPSSSFPQFDRQFVPTQFGYQPLPSSQLWYSNQLSVQQSQPTLMNNTWQFRNNNWPVLPVAKKPPPGFYPVENNKQTFSVQSQGPPSQVYQINYNQSQMPHMDFVHSQVSQIGFGCAPQMPQMGIGCQPHMSQVNYTSQVSQSAQLRQKVLDFILMTQTNSGLSPVINAPGLPFNPWLTNPGAVYNPTPISGSSFQSTLISELPPSPSDTPKSSFLKSDSSSEESSTQRPDSEKFSVQISSDNCEEAASTETVLNIGAKEFYLPKTETPPPETVEIPIAQCDSEPSDMHKLPQEEEVEESSIAGIVSSDNLHYSNWNVVNETPLDAEIEPDQSGSAFIYRSDDEDDDEDDYDDGYGFGEEENECEAVVMPENPMSCDNLLFDPLQDIPTVDQQVTEGILGLSSQNTEVHSVPTFEHLTEGTVGLSYQNSKVYPVPICEQHSSEGTVGLSYQNPEVHRVPTFEQHLTEGTLGLSYQNPNVQPVPAIEQQLTNEIQRLSLENPEVAPVPTIEKNSYLKLITVGNHEIHLFSIEDKDYVSTTELNVTYSLLSTQFVLLKILTSMNVRAKFLELNRSKWKELFEELDMCCEVAGLRKVNGKVPSKLHLTPVDDVASILRAVSKNADTQIKEFENALKKNTEQ